jgi:hypothetical protein
MMKLAMSAAAVGLLRALLHRAGVDRDRILLMDFRSMTWNSLTFDGERHQITLRVPGPDARTVVDHLLDGLSDHEFTIPGHVVADIFCLGDARFADDGSATLDLEALTVAD